ncbi:hypothetical protein HDR61_01080 [bacterium]|nr:hypothetical protein [bacterium]
MKLLIVLCSLIVLPANLYAGTCSAITDCTVGGRKNLVSDGEILKLGNGKCLICDADIGGEECNYNTIIIFKDGTLKQCQDDNGSIDVWHTIKSRPTLDCTDSDLKNFTKRVGDIAFSSQKDYGSGIYRLGGWCKVKATSTDKNSSSSAIGKCPNGKKTGDIWNVECKDFKATTGFNPSGAKNCRQRCNSNGFVTTYITECDAGCTGYGKPFKDSGIKGYTYCKCPDKGKKTDVKKATAKKPTTPVTPEPTPVSTPTVPAVPQKPNCNSLAEALSGLIKVCNNNDAKAMLVDATLICDGDDKDDITADILQQWRDKIEKQEQACKDTTAEEQLCAKISDAHMVDGVCKCKDSDQELDREKLMCKQSNSAAQDESKKKIKAAKEKIDGYKSELRKTASVWKDKNGNFNTARLASDSIAGVVLGTAGGLITSNIIKKNQIKGGFEDIKCSIGGQVVASYGDEFQVGVQ